MQWKRMESLQMKVYNLNPYLGDNVLNIFMIIVLEGLEE
jgi:hypothetical protein